MDAASIPSRITPFGDSCWVYSALECRLSKGISHGMHILFYHSDVTVISENRKNSIGDSEMIARDPEWRHIAVAVTFEAGNVYLIRFICDR